MTSSWTNVFFLATIFLYEVNFSVLHILGSREPTRYFIALKTGETLAVSTYANLLDYYHTALEFYILPFFT